MGRDATASPDTRQRFVCAHCGRAFKPETLAPRFCSAACSLRHYVARYLATCAPGAPVTGEVSALPAPDIGPVLPGAAMGVLAEDFDPGTHRARPSLMHWVGTALSGLGHDRRCATFAMWPEHPGWALYLPTDGQVLEVCDRTHLLTLSDGPRGPRGQIVGAPRPVRVGPPVALAAPAPLRPGRYRTRVIARTPVHTRSSGVFALDSEHRKASDDILSGTLTASLTTRVGLPALIPELIALETISSNVERLVVGSFSTKIKSARGAGNVEAWRGELVVESNALGAWLLDVAGRIGLGGKTAYGLGRVRVETVRCT